MRTSDRMRTRIDARDQGRRLAGRATWWAAGAGLALAAVFGITLGAASASATTNQPTGAPSRDSQGDSGSGLQPPQQAPAFGYGDNGYGTGNGGGVASSGGS